MSSNSYLYRSVSVRHGFKPAGIQARKRYLQGLTDQKILKTITYIIVLLTFFSCNNGQTSREEKQRADSTTVISKVDEDKKQIKYSDKQLESFLDSIGKLSTQPLIDKVAFYPDSIFKNHLQLSKTISPPDFDKLRKAINFKEISIETAKKIFGDIQIDSTFIEKGTIPLTLYSFDKLKKELYEFAICLGYPEVSSGCDLYFFKSNKIISKHSIYHRYGLELEHYRDSDGKTVIYYKENYESGSGIWWFNFYFYKYYDNELIPVLNELENGNLQSPWGVRVLWLESFIQKTNPLTIKMVYFQQFPDTTNPDIRPKIIDDSTIVTYNWDEKSKTFNGNYEKSKISKAQIYSYYLADNEILFINSYYKTLKSSLLDKDKRQLTLNYLNVIKNYYENKPSR